MLIGHFVCDLKPEYGVYVSRFRVRYVVNGNPLSNTVTYSQVVNIESMGYLLAYAVRHKINVHTIDIKNAYLNSEIKQEVFMTQPSLYIDTMRSAYACKLNKSQYVSPNSGYE